VPQLAFDLGDLNDRSPFVGRRLLTCRAMVEHLAGQGRLDVEHLPLVEHLYGLCEALDTSTGRGASYALLSAQFDKTWERLATLPFPEPDEGDDDIEFDVVLIPPAIEAAAS
jgi:hypothetical protein